MKGAAWLGFFFFVALVLLGFATLLVGDLSALFEDSVFIDVHFEKVQGLLGIFDEMRVQTSTFCRFYEALSLTHDGHEQRAAALGEPAAHFGVLFGRDDDEAECAHVGGVHQPHLVTHQHAHAHAPMPSTAPRQQPRAAIMGALPVQLRRRQPIEAQSSRDSGGEPQLV